MKKHNIIKITHRIQCIILLSTETSFLAEKTVPLKADAE